MAVNPSLKLVNSIQMTTCSWCLFGYSSTRTRRYGFYWLCVWLLGTWWWL